MQHLTISHFDGLARTRRTFTLSGWPRCVIRPHEERHFVPAVFELLSMQALERHPAQEQRCVLNICACEAFRRELATFPPKETSNLLQYVARHQRAKQYSYRKIKTHVHMHKHAVTFSPHYCWRSSTLHKTDDGQYLPVLSQCFHLLYVCHRAV